MTTQPNQKIVQYLNEAHASEQGLIRVLQSQIAMTPRGSYRKALEDHLAETHGHAERIEARVRDLGSGFNPFLAGLGLAESMFAQALAVSKTPIDMLRGTSGEEKVLKNAKDAAATEALEIATYASIERLANAVGDADTAKLAADIRGEEERMLQRILNEIPKLTDAVGKAELEGEGSFDVTKTGAADAARSAGRTARRTARRTAAKGASSASRTASRTRAAGSSTRSRGQASSTRRSTRSRSQASSSSTRSQAANGTPPIPRYDSLTADEVVAKLPGLSQAELAKVDAYERAHEDRTTVRGRIDALRGNEPWSGYDEQSVDEIRSRLSDADDARAKAARDYERSHKNRAGVLEAAQRELSNA